MPRKMTQPRRGYQVLYHTTYAVIWSYDSRNSFFGCVRAVLLQPQRTAAGSGEARHMLPRNVHSIT